MILTLPSGANPSPINTTPTGVPNDVFHELNGVVLTELPSQ